MSVLTMRRWRKEGVMRAYNPGGERTVRFCKAEVVEALANSAEDAASRFKSV